MNLLTGDADLGTVAGLIEDLRVDVVSFSELTPRAAQSVRQAPRSARSFPTRRSTRSSTPRGPACSPATRCVALPAPGTDGTDAPTVVAAVDAPGGSAEVWSIHPPPPTRPTAVSALAGYLGAIPPASAEGPPRVLIGDFNATLDNDTLRDVIGQGYTDAADARGAGLVPTWPAGLWPPPVTIDHVIADERAAILKYETAEIPGSDHRAVFAELRLPGIEPGTFGPLPAED